MRVVFMGTPDFAASILIELKEQHDVVAVYTRADAVRGRGKKLVPSPVKEVALGANIPVFEPRTLRDEAEVERLRALDPDVICVAAYGMILPQAVLDIPKHGCLNVHASLLPKYRGAAPIERAILNGDDEAGVCIMRMEAGLDTGDYCICRSCQIAGMNAERLTGELADKGAYALLSALYDVEHGVQRWVKQAEEDATWAPKIEKGELNLNPADRVRREPSPCAGIGRAAPFEVLHRGQRRYGAFRGGAFARRFMLRGRIGPCAGQGVVRAETVVPRMRRRRFRDFGNKA